MNAYYGIKRVDRLKDERPAARGVALIFTLLILALLMILSLGMVIALSSQTFIGGYYRNFRGAFYSADSGLNISRQAMVNEILAQAPATITLGSQPLTAASVTTVQNYMNNTYGSWTSIGGGQATNSWPGQFEVNSSNPATFVLASCTPSFTAVGTPPAGGPYTCASPPPASSTCSTAGGITNNCYIINNFQYTYNYTLDILGEVKGNEQSELAENGNISITVNVSPPTGTTTNQSFAAWGTFLDQYAACSSMFVPGTLTGPFFTNGSWNFGDTGSYIFTDSVGSHSSTASYIFSNESGSPCQNEAATSDTYKGETINPQFQAGLALGQNSVPLPTNDYSQKWAVLDGKGCGEGSNVCGNLSSPAPPLPTNAQLNAILRDATETPYSSSGATSGVYLPYSLIGGGPTMEGGGIYVEGSASITLTAGTATSSSSPEIYSIVQSGSQTTTSTNTSGATIGINHTTGAACSTPSNSGTCRFATQTVTTQSTPTTTYTVTVDDLANSGTGSTVFSTATTSAVTTTTTLTCNNCSESSTSGPVNSTVNSPVTTAYITGVPQQRNASGAVTGDATMLYVDGNITSLSGPESGGGTASSGAAVQNGTALTITALDNVTITGDIKYVTEPVTTTQNQIAGTPADTLIPGNNKGQVLGIFTAVGDIQMNNLQSSGNLEIDASIAMISSGGSGGWVNTGAHINTLTLIGGRIANQALSGNTTTRNIYFDRRFAQGGFSPPWYPATTVTVIPTGVEDSTASTPTVSRVQWVCKSCQS